MFCDFEYKAKDHNLIRLFSLSFGSEKTENLYRIKPKKKENKESYKITFRLQLVNTF